MNKLKLLILAFFIGLCIPLAYFVVRTYQGLEQEERATLQYFAETLFDEMEQALAKLVVREEGRAVDEYNYEIFPPGRRRDSGSVRRSPLSRPAREDFILGYFQNNPDGSFQSPLVQNEEEVSDDRGRLLSRLEYANRIFNQKRVASTDKIEARPARFQARTEEKRAKGFADKYLDLSRSQQPKDYLGQKEKRVEKITVGQARNIAKQEYAPVEESTRPSSASRVRKPGPSTAGEGSALRASAGKMSLSQEAFQAEAESLRPPAPAVDVDESENFQVEVAPLQAVFIDDNQIYVFRRIMINNQIYRQGFILKVERFLQHLAQAYFANQPMAEFTNLRLRVMDQERIAGGVESGVVTEDPSFVLDRTFPSPFGFLRATLSCDQIPRSAGRRTLNVMIVVLAAIISLGFLAIYQSVRAIVAHSERRSQFVSSVTHELKTPLTNIRMYIEMLEQGIAQNPEREQEYFRILESEGSRLSRLINNVLELSKLEKKQRAVDFQSGTFEDVIHEVEAVMHAKLKQEGFTLKVEQGVIRPFKYDREMMIQVLINLIENCMKFGKTAAMRRITIQTRQIGDRIKISVSDTGPGIPRHALRKVFDDFYRVDNSLTRTTRGTGIGLALVKKFITLQGGTVSAANNEGSGCTITISLPA